jgi:hypothetical protein
MEGSMRAASIGVLFLLLFPVICMPDVPITEIGRDEIFSAGPEWKENYEVFKPNPEAIQKLKSMLGSDLKIDIYLGLWCPDSRNNVPPFLKILDSLDVPVPIRYFSVQRKPAQSVRYYFEQAGVERVPTFIFFRDGREIGRIVEHPQSGLADDTIAIMSK